MLLGIKFAIPYKSNLMSTCDIFAFFASNFTRNIYSIAINLA
jgi:hypothetical protein